MLIVVFSWTAAQSGDPADNACYDGGTLAGQCHDDFMWQVGWYKARLDDGRIAPSQLPPDFQYLAPDGTIFENSPASNENPSACGYPFVRVVDQGAAGIFYCVQEAADTPEFCFLRP
jgi:hypothetical protein